MHKKARLEYHPLGVVAAIIPWNYPFQKHRQSGDPRPDVWKRDRASSLRSGWRGLAQSSSTRFESVIEEAGHESGPHPSGCKVTDPTGAALARSAVDTILFIGSVNNGRRVVEASAERVIPVVMELGGKDAFIVCDDADLEQAVHAALAGCYINCGQNCVASERILVYDAVYEAFEKRAAELVGEFRQGSSREGVVDVGAIVTPLQLDVIEKAVNGAIAQGARLVTGGKRALTDTGDYFEPTILADVTPDRDIAQEEVFGPVDAY